MSGVELASVPDLPVGSRIYARGIDFVRREDGWYAQFMGGETLWEVTLIEKFGGVVVIREGMPS